MTGRTATSARAAGYAAIFGALTMLVGAALWGTSGTDLWAALDGGNLSAYLVGADAVRGQLVANLSVWILGTLVLGFAGPALANLGGSQSIASRAAEVCYRTGVPMVVVSYVIMLAVVVQTAPDTSATGLAVAKTVGWIGIRVDDIATALMIGIGPLFIAMAGKGEWVPNWLLRWGYLTTALGAFSIFVLYFPGMSQYGFAVIPVGVGWMIAAGAMALRKA